MKTRFNTYDIVCMVAELQRLVGMRVNQVYDIDNKTYVIRLHRTEEKSVLLLESGNKFHTTQFEWPKNVAPSGFTMKLRKHLKNKRLEKLTQLGIDRIVDLQFGSGEAAYHVILELYDRGNIVLTDFEWTILNVLRPHVEGDKVRFAVREKYPLDRAKTDYSAPNADTLTEIFGKSKPGDNIKKILNPNLEYGSAVIDHVLLENGLSGNMKVSQDPNKGFYLERDLDNLVKALKQAEMMIEQGKTKVAKGYIIQKKEDRPNPEGGGPDFLLTNQEFQPMLYAQNKDQPHTEYESFDRAVDEFYSALEGQKIDLKMIQVEREAMKKLHNVRKDHDKRITELERLQLEDRKAAEMISRNESLVEQARLAITTAIANQMSWDDIKVLVKTAQDNKDPIASSIKQLKLNTNHITLLLKDPYDDEDDDGDDGDKLKPMLIDIDLSLTAFANARRYYDQKRTAAKKQQKTLESADKALKSAERKTKQTLKEAHTISNITKARKTYWFEKFYWFISSDNYLVIAGRDQQQNELLVKRYMRASDVYVHADVSGASSVLVKCPAGPPPPRTLGEAGQAAVAYSVAWEAKVLTRAWWVFGHQVSKSAPTGEYLTTGSFMIRGKKTYLLPEHLQFGFSFLFRLEDSCIERHREERKSPEDASNVSDEASKQAEEDQEIVVSDDDEASDKEDIEKNSLDVIPETGPVAETKENCEDDQENDQKDDQKDDQENDQKDDNEDDEEDDEEDDDDESEEIIPGDSPIKVTDEDLLFNQKLEDFPKRLFQGELEIEPSSSDGFYPGVESFGSSDRLIDTYVRRDPKTGLAWIERIDRYRMRTPSNRSLSDETRMLTFPYLPEGLSYRRAKKSVSGTDKREKKERSVRRQRRKMKKIKEKYRHQDEEDRALMMELLKPDKPPKMPKQSQKKHSKDNKSKPEKGPKIPPAPPLILEAESDADEPEPEVEQSAPDADTEMLCQLTGNPLAEDELLFAVPVVAPYSALINYKYKVKLTPGNNKRGKAAKTAVQVFLRDKNSSNREKDLLKAVKEENVARNFPGKVKLSAPQLHKHRK